MSFMGYFQKMLAWQPNYSLQRIIFRESRLPVTLRLPRRGIHLVNLINIKDGWGQHLVIQVRPGSQLSESLGSFGQYRKQSKTGPFSNKMKIPLRTRRLVKLLDPQEVRLQLRIPILYRPKAQRDRRQFIYYRNCVAVLRQIDRLNVVTAGIARLDSHVVKLVCRVNDKLFDVFFSTGWTQHALKVPFRSNKDCK